MAIRYFADPRLIPLAVALETLELDPDNELAHTPESVQEIVKLLVRFGWRDPVGALRSRKRVKIVIRGNRTLMAARWLAEAAASDDPELRARAMGHESWWSSADPPDWLMAPALFFADDAATRVAWRISHNKSAEAPAWDWGILAENMAEVSDEVDWGELGWSAAELAELFEDEAEEDDGPGEDDEEETIPDVPADPVTQPGDIWHLGDHRLICGDCRDPEVVARLLDGEVVNVAFTSPPYASQRKYDESSGFKPIKPDDYVDWFEAVQANVREHPGKWSNRLKNAWEPVFHFAVGAVKLVHENIQYPTDDAITYSIDNPKTHSGFVSGSAGGRISGYALPSNVIKVHSHPAQIAAGPVKHTATFPVGLPTFFVKAYSDPGDRVFDPFMGSGTVIIACEREGRLGYGCEVSRGYCDVIVERWEAETGKKAKRIAA